MQDTDDNRLRESRSGVFKMSNSNSAFQSQHSFARASSADRDHEALVKAAMQEAARHPERHRMTALPSKTKSSVEVIDVKKLTTSQKRLVLSRAMETSGQDNERLLNQIRQRQDRCDWALSVLLTALVNYLHTTYTAALFTHAKVWYHMHIAYAVTATVSVALHAGYVNLNFAAWAYRVGLERSRVEIQFTNINYEAEVLIGSSGLPSVSNSFKNLALVLSLTLYAAAVSAAPNAACNKGSC